jgi:hypothetical protein
MALAVDMRYWPAVSKIARKTLERMTQTQEGSAEVYVDLDLPLRKRSLEQNALMWSLYEIEANEQNAHQKGGELVTAEQLYDADMKDERVVPMVKIVIKKEILDDLEKIGVRWLRVEPMVGSDLVRVLVAKTSSRWDVGEACRHIDMMFNRLAVAGVTNSDEILTYWTRWRQHVSDRKIDYEDLNLSAAEYRESHRICEGCGKMADQLHHIRSRGAATIEEAERADDWMMLCVECHDLWNRPGGGVVAFVEKYPHTRFRVEKILGEVA